MSECTHDCSTCGADCASRGKPESLLEAQNAFSNVKKVIAVVSGKGGVGKSLVTSLLAVLAKRSGYNTAVLDADITGPSIPKIFGVREKAMGTVDGIILVTSPQELVGMIVEKAVNMAKMMNIPVLGLVENMSWIACPDCGKKVYPFGESRSAQIAVNQGIPLLAQLPIEPALARECDTGVIELFNENWLDPVLRAVEDCPKKKAQ